MIQAIKDLFKPPKESLLRENADIIINLTSRYKKAILLGNSDEQKDDLDLNQKVFKCYARDIDQNKTEEEQEKELTEEKKVISPKGFYAILGKGTWSDARTIIFALPNDIKDLPIGFQSGENSLLFTPFIIKQRAYIDILEARRLEDREKVKVLKKSEGLFAKQLQAWTEQQINDFNTMVNKEKDNIYDAMPK